MLQRRKWRDKLAGSGFRLTAGRQAIIDVLSHAEDHLSAEDIFLVLRADQPGFGFTTIYRTLELLVQTGIVSKYDFGHGRARYELAEEYGKKKHHHHLICKKCKTIVDSSNFLKDELQYIKKTEKGISKKYSFLIDSHEISFFGVCNQCRSK